MGHVTQHEGQVSSWGRGLRPQRLEYSQCQTLILARHRHNRTPHMGRRQGKHHNKTILCESISSL